MKALEPWVIEPLETFLAQLKEESTPMAEGYQQLERILRGEETQN